MKKLLSVLLVSMFVIAGCGELSEDGTLLIKTADPQFNIHVRLLQPVAAPEVAPDVLPEPTATPECVIKVNWTGTEFIFHLPGQSSYTRTIIEPAKNEFLACTEQEAIDAGARKALR